MSDSIPAAIPEFAVVGHPNEGKSSVVATLAEDDHVRISEIPGETIASCAYPVRVDGREILRFIDTPGFQHPTLILDWMRPRVAAGGNLARDFIEAHRQTPALAQDLELLGPLAAGAGIIYVVDGSRPVRRHDQAEMEILRLCGNPRMALINPKEAETAYLDDWKAAAARSFNSTRVFNAVRATYAERLALLESLKGIQQDWEPALAAAIEAFRRDWIRRGHRVAGIIVDLLRDALTHVESRNVFEPGAEEAARIALVNDYQRTIANLEARAQAEVRRLYKHNIFDAALPAQSILREDLFTEKTWQLLGLNRRQVLVAAAVIGAGAGVKLDLIFGHLTFGLFTLSGAALGAAAAYFQGENMARAKVQRMRLGGVQISVGPNQNPQFPFVLLDRMLLYYQATINWAHARRAENPMAGPETETKLGFTSGWPRERRQIVLNHIKSLSRGDRQRQDDTERALLELFQTVLTELSGGASASLAQS